MSSKDRTYPFEIKHFPEEYVKVAQRELNEFPEKTASLIVELKNMAKSDKTLNDLDFHPDFLLQFLRVSKFNLNASFKRLQKYTNLRRKNSGFFTGVQDNISATKSYRWASPLPRRSPEGCAILVFKFGAWDNEISFEHINRLAHIVVQQSLRNPVTQINGVQLILDFEGTSFRHLKHANPTNLYLVAQMHLECSPARFKKFHCINSTMAMKIAYSLIHPFLSEKLRRRFLFHKNVGELLNYFPKHTLPVEYGGTIENYYMDSWMREANDQMAISTLKGQQNIF